MGRSPCCEKKGLKKGPWTPEEDELLVDYIKRNGHGTWRSLPKLAGLLRCGKSCRLRWTNYLRPDIKRGPFTSKEEKLVIKLHGILGNRWAAIAAQLRGRTDNEIKNLWNTHLKKRLICMGRNPQTHEPVHLARWESARLEAEVRLSRAPHVGLKQATPPDHFLRLWNSQVGESFRNIKLQAEACQSPPSQVSSSTKCGSVSAISTEIGPAVAVAGSEASSSSEFEDSSDITMELLLDYPINNDMSFLELL